LKRISDAGAPLITVRVIAHAKIKTDTIDASVLAQLCGSGFLPEVRIPDQPTQAPRRQVTRRNQTVRQRSRLKNIIQSMLHSHLIPSCPHADLCGASGRARLFHQVLPEDERLAVERHLTTAIPGQMAPISSLLLTSSPQRSTKVSRMSKARLPRRIVFHPQEGYAAQPGVWMDRNNNYGSSIPIEPRCSGFQKTIRRP
jgi:transposase